MNLKQLRVFYEVARRGRFTAAARTLGLSQPAVSMQVKSLQVGLGVVLYRTEGKRFELTDAGRLLMDYAERIFPLADEAEQRLAALQDLRSAKLRISTTRTIATYFLPRVIGAFKGLHHGVSIRLDIGTNASAIEAVLIRMSDVGLVVNSTEREELGRMTLFEDPLVLIVPPSHRLATRQSHDSLDLERETLILRERGSKTREAVELALRDRGIQVGQMMEIADLETIKSTVRAGLGVSVLPSIAVQEEVLAGTLVVTPFLGDEIRLRFEAIHRTDVTSGAVQAFLKALIPVSFSGRTSGKRGSRVTVDKRELPAQDSFSPSEPGKTRLRFSSR